jgi:uncharacterized protein (DUF305 family)
VMVDRTALGRLSTVGRADCTTEARAAVTRRRRKERHMNRAVVLLPLLACLSACGAEGPSGYVETNGETAESARRELPGQNRPGAPSITAPAQIVIRGEYSDGRFLDMLAAHHRAGVRLAEFAMQHRERVDLGDLAARMRANAVRELERMHQIREEMSGQSLLAFSRDPQVTENSGVPPLDELADTSKIDRAILDAMIAHEAESVHLAAVAHLRTWDIGVHNLAGDIMRTRPRTMALYASLRESWFPPSAKR